MKVGIIVSGHVRTLLDNIDSWKDNLLSFYDCDIFFSLWDTLGAGGHKLEYTPSEDFLTCDYSDKLREIFFKSEIEFENYQLTSNVFSQAKQKYYSGHPYVNNIYSMWYKVYKSFRMVSTDQYDIILRIRPDHYFTEPLILKKPLDNTVFCDVSYAWDDCTLSDQFFYGNYDVMKKVCNFYKEFDSVYYKGMTPDSPEYTFFKYLEYLNIDIDRNSYFNIKINRVKGQEYH